MNNNDAPTPPSDPAGLSRWPQSSHNDPETPQAQRTNRSSVQTFLSYPRWMRSFSWMNTQYCFDWHCAVSASMEFCVVIFYNP